MVSRAGKLRFVLVAVATLATATVLASGNDLAMRLRGLRITLRPKSAEAAVVRVSIRDARLDHERRGFFKIGLLPRLVAEDVSLEVLEPGSLTEALTRLPGLLRSGGKNLPVELRNLSVSFPGDETPRLTASRVRLAKSTTWNLSGPIAWRSANDQGRAQQASLCITGPQAGWLIIMHPVNAPGVDLFADERISTPQPNP